MWRQSRNKLCSARRRGTRGRLSAAGGGHRLQRQSNLGLRGSPTPRGSRPPHGPKFLPNQTGAQSKTQGSTHSPGPLGPQSPPTGPPQSPPTEPHSPRPLLPVGAGIRSSGTRVWVKDTTFQPLAPEKHMRAVSRETTAGCRRVRPRCWSSEYRRLPCLPTDPIPRL